MVAEAANATVTIWRATGKDKYGQPNAWTPLYTGVPAVFLDILSGNPNTTDTTPTGTRTVPCTLPAELDLRPSDQVQNDATGHMYLVATKTRPPTLIGAPVDLKVTLQRTAGGGA